MQGQDTTLTRLISDGETQFCIPVYQRDYSWKVEQCAQLYDDLMEVVERQRPHFFGSIVISNDPGDMLHKRVVIDGQQRITTISLLLLAFKKTLRENKLQPGKRDPSHLIKAADLFLKTTYDEIRFHPAETSVKAYEALCNDDDTESINGSRIIGNYNYFVERLTKEKRTASEIWEAITTLQIIIITLSEKEDDAQRIFESLNSTGLALYEGDKIRNYLLMSFSLKKQEEYYKKYWAKIAENTGSGIDSFFRNYLWIKRGAATKAAPKEEEIYDVFKSYAGDYHIDKTELISDVYKYSRYYSWIENPQKSPKEFQNPLGLLKELGFDVTAYLLQLFNYYDSDHKISAEDVIESLKIVENHLFRLVACGVSPHSNKIFVQFHNKILNLKGNTESYPERLKYLILRKVDKEKYPRDSQFSEMIRTRPFYSDMKEKYTRYLLERLEQHANRNNMEKIDILSLKKVKQLSIEHIMPQTRTPQWNDDLGGTENADRIYDEWLNRLGNLTLLASKNNVKNSNRPFLEKRDKENGFKESKFKLNQYVAECEKWTEEEMKKRTDILLESALEIWGELTTSFKEDENIDGALIGLDEDVNFTEKQIRGFMFKEKPHKDVRKWTDFLVESLRELYDIDKEPLYALSQTPGDSLLEESFDVGKENINSWRHIRDDLFVRCANKSASTKIELLKSCLDLYNLNYSDIQIKLSNSLQK